MLWKDKFSYSQVHFITKSKRESFVLPSQGPFQVWLLPCARLWCFQALGIADLASTWHCRAGPEPTFHQLSFLAQSCPECEQGTPGWGRASFGMCRALSSAWCFPCRVTAPCCLSVQRDTGTAPAASLRTLSLLFLSELSLLEIWGVLSLAAFAPRDRGRTEPRILCAEVLSHFFVSSLRNRVGRAFGGLLTFE